MILGKDKVYFTKKHIESTKGFAPAYLNELVIYSLELVSLLSHYSLNYRFKGGNSLLLILDEPERFSIDVDIATTVSREYLIELMKKIVNDSSLFYRYEIRQHKTKPWIPLISFKLYFHSFYQKEKDSYIMLDGVLEAPPYEGMIKRVKCLNIYESEERVEVPTISGLIGDKLLTIGPKTLGIPIGKGKEAHRLKHVFDLGLLVQKNYDIKKVKQSIISCMDQENKIQKTNYSLKEIFEDTMLFLSKPLKYREKPDIQEVKNDPYLYEIVKGFDNFQTHLFKRKYNWMEFNNEIILPLLTFLHSLDIY